jgi:hypothetical protein
MADLGGYLGTSSEGIGQGLAFVLPQSNTERYAMQLAQEHAAQMRAEALRQQKLQQQQEAAYQTSISAQKLPDYWAKTGQQINDNYNSWLKSAASYHASTGKDPFKNPEFLQRYNNEVLLPARQSKELETAYNNGLAKVAADSDNKFTEDSKNRFNQFVQSVDKNPMQYLGQAIPQLEGTPSSVNDFNKLIKPVTITNDNGTLSTTVPDTSAMMRQAYVQSNDPRWNNLKRVQYGINTDLGDIGGIYNKDGKRVWHTNPAATGYLADEILGKPTVPHNAEVLAKAGISPDDPYAKEKLQDIITKQNAGYGKFISDAGRYGNSLVSKKSDSNPDKFYEHYQYELSHPKREAKQEQPSYFQDLSERIRNGDDSARQEFGKIFENNPAFLNGVHFDVSNPKAVKISIPAKYNTDVSKISQDDKGNNVPNSERKLAQQPHTYTLDSTDPVAWTTALSQIYSSATGEKAAVPSKSLTPNAKGKVPGGQQVTTAKRLTDNASGEDMVTVSVNGRTGQIPKKNLSAFIKQYPGAKQL